MNDIERVRALRDAGQITPEEAERLIGVLTELDETPDGVTVEAPNPDAPVGTTDATASEAGGNVADRVRSAARGAAEAAREAAREASSQVRGAVAEARGPAGAAAVETPAIDLAPAGTRWCTIELTAADLSVVADDVDEPVVEGDDDQKLRVTQTDDGVRVTSERGWSIERWVGRSLSLDVHVRVPRAWGVALDLKAGDADVAGVPYVRGRMLAGDLSVRDAVAVDLSKAAGDLSVAFRPTQGRHRINAKAGDVDVRFLPGSDASVEASVSMGDLHAPGFEVDDRMVGAQARGRLGAGTAQVEVRLTAGDLNLRAPAKEG
ncbi:MAG: DUF4097 family beta strand repeat-containing protein [Trueperaceae bacterium]